MPLPPAFDELFGQLRAGGDDAAREVVRQYSLRLIGMVRGRLSDRVLRKEDPEDIAQSAFKSFFRGCADDRFALGGWDDLWAVLVTITVRKCLRRARRYSTAGRRLDREAGDADAARLVARDPPPEHAAVMAELLDRLFRSLPADQAQVVAHSLSGYSVGETAALVGCSERTVQRVHERVRLWLEGEARPPEDDE